MTSQYLTFFDRLLRAVLIFWALGISLFNCDSLIASDSSDPLSHWVLITGGTPGHKCWTVVKLATLDKTVRALTLREYCVCGSKDVIGTLFPSDVRIFGAVRVDKLPGVTYTARNLEYPGELLFSAMKPSPWRLRLIITNMIDLQFPLSLVIRRDQPDPENPSYFVAAPRPLLQ